MACCSPEFDNIGDYVVGSAALDFRDTDHRRLRRIDVAADDALEKVD